VDAEIITDASRFSMDLVAGLERTLQGSVKPMISQCEMRKLYNAEHKDEDLIEQAKRFERKRCNHHELEEPLSTLQCLSECVDPKSNHTNRHRYVVASQSQEVRAAMREIKGVPLVYIHRSVMIMEPMAESSQQVRDREEKGKFRAGLANTRRPQAGEKRKRDESEYKPDRTQEESAGETTRKKRMRGPKGPNPLSVKKPKKREEAITGKEGQPETNPIDKEHDVNDPILVSTMKEGLKKRKRKRKHGPDIEVDGKS
jgi:U3 small nucleolar RNA-associated protein 23